MLLEDRYWRWRSLHVVMALLIAALEIAYYLRCGLLYDERVRVALVPDSVALLIAVAALAAFMVSQIVAMRAERARMRRRHAAMAGDPDAMPLAHLQLPASHADEALPLALSRVPPWQTWAMVVISLVCISVMLLFAFVPHLWLVRSLADILTSIVRGVPARAPAPASPSVHVSPFAISVPTSAPLFACLLVWAGVTGIAFFLRSLATAEREARMGDDGIFRQSAWGRTTLLRWEEMRLLEVSAELMPANGKKPSSWRHVLAAQSERVAIAWMESDDAPGALSPRAAAALHLIQGRSGLEPRTFQVWPLGDGARPEPSVWQGWRLVAVAAVLFAYLLDVCLAEAPYSTFYAQSALIVFCLLAMTSGGLAYSYWSHRRRRQHGDAGPNGPALQLGVAQAPEATALPPERSSASPLAASASASPGEVYEFAAYTGPTSRQCRIIYGVMAPIYAGGAAFIFAVTGEGCIMHHVAGKCLPYTPGGWAALIIVEGIGWLMLSVALSGRPQVLLRGQRFSVLADADGLTARRWPCAVTIRWQDVGKIELTRMSWWQGYRVISSTSLYTSIAWPRSKMPRPAPLSHSGHIRLDADALATLAAERSGRRIRYISRADEEA